MSTLNLTRRDSSPMVKYAMEFYIGLDVDMWPHLFVLD